MSQKYVTGLHTVFGIRMAPRLPWRDRQHERRLHAAWQQAAREAHMPIVYTATDENAPIAGVRPIDGGQQ